MIRLAWKLPNGCEGHGRSFEESERGWLQRHAETMNLHFVAGKTHWIEECGYGVAQWNGGPGKHALLNEVSPQ